MLLATNLHEKADLVHQKAGFLFGFFQEKIKIRDNPCNQWLIP